MLGQHKLLSKEILDLEVKLSNIKKEDKVIEIGSGDGNLTELIAKTKCKIDSYEIDSNYKSQLSELSSKYSNLTIYSQDALKSKWYNYTKLISNTPYHIAESIILRSLDTKIKNLTLIVGKTLSDKLKEKTKIGIISNLFFNIRYIKEISKDQFDPKPRTLSYLITLERKTPKSKKEKILHNIFSYNGKTKNAIISALVKSGRTKNQSRETLKKMNLNPLSLDKHPHDLTYNVITRIFDNIAHTSQPST